MAMIPITMKWLLFRDDADQPRSQRSLLYLLEAAVWHNLQWLKAYPRTPPLYKAGIVYKQEPEGQEEFADIPTVQAQTWGDCDDLAPWRVAELRRLGIPAKVYVRYRREGQSWHYHVLVRWPNGRLEDPSRRLGMDGGGSRWVGWAPSVAPWRKELGARGGGAHVAGFGPTLEGRPVRTTRLEIHGWEMPKVEILGWEMPHVEILGPARAPLLPAGEIRAPLGVLSADEKQKRAGALGRADLIRILSGGISFDLPVIGKKTFSIPRADVERALDSAEDFIRGAAYDAGKRGALAAVPEIERKVRSAVLPIAIGGVLFSGLLAVVL